MIIIKGHMVVMICKLVAGVWILHAPFDQSTVELAHADGASACRVL